MRSIFRIVAVVGIIVGIALFVMGLQLADTFSNKLVKEMAGEYPDDTLGYIFGGVILFAVSLGYLVFSFLKKK